MTVAHSYRFSVPLTNPDNNGAFVNMSWDRPTSHRTHRKRNALGGKSFGGNIFVAHGGKIFAISLTSSFPVCFLFRAMENPRPLQLSLTPTQTFHSWISLHLIRSGLHWTCITHCTAICAILTIDDLEGREACRSCSWLLTGARQRLAVDVFPRGGFRGVANFVHGKMDGMHV